MSETMVERVAKAICEESGQAWDVAGQGYREHCTEFARAALEAMREPTVEMQIAAAGEIQVQDIVLDEDHSGPISPSGIYRAMLDAALSPPSNGEK